MRLIVLVAVMTALGVTPALAHASGRGFVMLLPTGYVTAGGALAVLVSFMALSLLPARPPREPVMTEMERPAFGRILSLISAIILGLLIVIGFMGPRDPAENLLPITIWTLWWVVIVMLHPLFGDLWAKINPFTGLHALLTASWRTRDSRALLRYPDWLSYWPAVWVFFAFAWFQLVFPAPEDPAILAIVVLCYAVATLAAILLFGPARWLGKADPFAVFFSQLGALAPFGNGGWRWPGAGLFRLPALPVSGVLFVLLTLSTITFDGFANTFVWLSIIGVNPLDYPGRSAVLASNTLGLIMSFLILGFGFFAAVALGWAWAGRPRDLRRLCGRLVFSLIPISIAYHFAHYLSDTLLALQYAVVALNDPLQNGAQLLGLGHVHVTASFQNTASGTFALYTTQTAAIVIGHVVGVVVAHAMAAETAPSRAQVFKLELPLAICMVAYTGLGLWLLGAPSIA